MADGRKKCDTQVYNYLAAMGVYQEGVAKREVNGKQVQAHIYEVEVQKQQIAVGCCQKGLTGC